MPNFNIGGLASGLDTNAIIEQLIALESRPLQRLEAQKSALTQRQGKFSEFKSKLQKLADEFKNLGKAKEIALFQTTSSDEDVAKVTATQGAIDSTFTLVVSTLATAKSVAYESPFADKDQSTFGDGSIAITVDGTTKNVTVGASDTLEDIRDAINDADAGVRANIIHDGSAYQLVVSSEESGVANRFTLTASGFTDPGESDPFGTASTLAAGNDAAFTINGLPITASSNEVEDAVEGLTFSLKSAGTTTVTVERDVTAIGDRLQKLVDSFNDVVSFIDAQDIRDDSALRGIKNRLQSTMQSLLDDDSGLTFTALSQLGIESNAGGKLQVDREVLEQAVEADFDGFIEAFTGTDAGVDGFSQVFESLFKGSGGAPGLLSAGDGALQLRQNALSDRIRGIDAQIELAEKRLDRSEDYLLRRFASYETLIGQFQSQGSFLSASLARL